MVAQYAIPVSTYQSFHVTVGKTSVAQVRSTDSPILIIRDARTISMKGTYGATEMVIAVRPCGVLRTLSEPAHSHTLLTGPRHHLADFCHRREAGKAPLNKT